MKDKLIGIIQDNVSTPDAFISVASEHGVLGFLSEDSHEFKRQYLKNSLLLKVVDDLFLRDDFKERAILLKGMALLKLGVYNLGERSIGDIDLLVDDLSYFSDKLQELGYRVVKENKWKENIYKINVSKLINGIEVVIELHSKLFSHLNNDWIELSETTDGIKILANEEMMIHLIGHLVRQHTFLKLSWLIDIYLFHQKFEKRISMDKIKNKCKKLELFHSLKLANLALVKMFNYQMLSEMKYNYFEESLLDNEFLLYPNRNRIDYFIIKHLAKDRLLDAIKYDINWFMARGWNKNG